MKTLHAAALLALVLTSGIAHAADATPTATPTATEHGESGVQVRGDGSVHVKAGSGHVDVGSDGSVRVEKGGRTVVDVQPGRGVRVDTTSAPAGTAAVPGEILAENGKKTTYDCHGANVTVRGNSNAYKFVHCGTVYVAGNDNKLKLSAGSEVLEISGGDNAIFVESLAAVRITGNDNKVTWEGPGSVNGTSTIDNTGRDNDVRPR